MALADDEQRWQDWVDQVCGSLDVDSSRVDVSAVLGLTRDIAHRFDRPMAPVGSFMLGLALGSDPTATMSEVVSRIEATLPTQPGEPR